MFNEIHLPQGVKDCSQLSELINFNQILKNFRLEGRRDTLNLIDKKGVISKECLSIKWGDCYLSITHDSALIKRAIKGGSSAFFKGECEYFVLDNFKQNGKSYFFTIFRACSNEFVECKLIKDKNQYKLISISGGEY
jgi:hypothetical protein